MRFERQKRVTYKYLKNTRYSAETYKKFEKAMSRFVEIMNVDDYHDDFRCLGDKLDFLRYIGIRKIMMGRSLRNIPESNEKALEKFFGKHISAAVRNARIECLEYLCKYGGKYNQDVRKIERGEISVGCAGEQFEFEFSGRIDTGNVMGDLRDSRADVRGIFIEMWRRKKN